MGKILAGVACGIVLGVAGLTAYLMWVFRDVMR